jgi:hypothetical protein
MGNLFSLIPLTVRLGDSITVSAGVRPLAHKASKNKREHTMSASREALRQNFLNRDWTQQVNSCVTSELDNLDQLLQASPKSIDDVSEVLTSLELGGYWRDDHQKLSQLLAVFTRDVPPQKKGEQDQRQTVTDSLEFGGFYPAGYVEAHAEVETDDDPEPAERSMDSFRQALEVVREQVTGLRNIMTSQSLSYSTLDDAVARATTYTLAAGPLLNHFEAISAKAKESESFEQGFSSSLLNQDWTDAKAITQQTMITKLITRLGYEREVLRKMRGSVGWTDSEAGRTEAGNWGVNHTTTVERLGELMTYPTTGAKYRPQGQTSLTRLASDADDATVLLLKKLKALNTANSELHDAELLRLLTKYSETTSLFTDAVAESTQAGSA